jgi:GT2 family glycosyltransferase
VVLNYNGRDHLPYCLPSLAATDYANHRLLVVDNASPDGSAALVPALCPAAQLLVSPVNRGWSGGNNFGIEEALRQQAKYVVLANNDIRVDPRWIRIAVDVAESEPRIGIVGFAVIEAGGVDHDAGFQGAIKAWSQLAIRRPADVGGMAMFVRAELFSQLGLIDEGFFAYGEENDFQRRARKAGYETVAINVPVWHYGQAAFGKIPARAALLQTRANIRLLIKHGTLRQTGRSVLNVFRRFRRMREGGETNPAEQRLQGSGRISTHLWLLLRAFAWNLCALPATLRRRREDNRRAAAVAGARLHS